MDQRAEKALDRWRAAGVLDAATAERIRAWEAAHGEPTARRLSKWVLAIGGLLTAAGLLLVVAANWAKLSPWSRFALVLGMTGALHAMAALNARRSSATAMTLHAVGTAAYGAAIFRCRSFSPSAPRIPPWARRHCGSR